MTQSYSYPGLSATGVTDSAVRELLVKFTSHAISALQEPGEDTGIKWANGLYHETPISLGDDITKVEIDLTALDGFKEWAGVRKFADTAMTAVPVTAKPFDRAIGWDKNKALRGIYGSFPEQGAKLVRQGQMTLPRLIADIFKGGKAAPYLCYDGKPFWSTTHLIDPLGKDVTANRQSNYKAAYGKFTSATFRSGRTLMRQMRGLMTEPLGYTVTDIIGPTHMEEHFEDVLDQNKLIVVNSAGTASDSNISRGKANFRICSQLDSDPYVIADPSKHMWIMLCLNVVGVKPIEVVQTNGGVPMIEFLGEESEWCKINKKIGVVADQEVGAAPGFYMTAIRFEET